MKIDEILSRKPIGKVTLPSKKLLIFMVAGGVFAVISWWIMLLVSFSQDSVREEILAALEKQLGRKVHQADEVHFSLFPLPTLTLNNLNVENDPRSRHPSMLRVPQVVVLVNPYSIFGSDTYVEVSLISPRIEIETFDDGSSSWDVRASESEGQAAVIAGIEVINGEIHYSYPAVDRDITVRNIHANVQFPNENRLNASGSMSASQAHYQFGLAVGLSSDTVRNVDFNLFDGTSMLQVKGEWNAAEKSFTGEQKLESNDLGILIRNFLSQNEYADSSSSSQQSMQGQTPVLPADAALYPIQCYSAVTYAGGKLMLGDITFKGEYLQGKGNITTQISAQPVIDVRFDFEKFSLAPLSERGIIYDLMTQNGSSGVVNGYKVNLPGATKAVLPKGLTLSLIITGKEMPLFALPARDVQIAGKLEDSRITLSQFSGRLPGDSQFIIKGNVEGTYEGLSLKGQFDVGGKDFTQIAAPLLGENVGVPERLKSFRGRANIFLTPDLVRLSETILRVEDYQLLGTILRQHQKNTRDEKVNTTISVINGNGIQPTEALPPEVSYEGALRIDNMNFDEWGDVQKLRVEKKNSDTEEYPLLFRLVQQWQRQAKNAAVNFRVNLFDYTLNNRKRPKANFNFVVNEGGVALNNLETDYNGTRLSGSVGVAYLPNAVPEIQADIRADMVNSNTFFGHDFSKDESLWRDIEGGWSRREFMLDWARRYNGRFSLLIGSLKHEIHDLTNVSAEAEIQNSSVQLTKFEADIWGGRVYGKGRMLANKLPSFSGDFAMKGIDIVRLRSITDMFGDLIGRVSLSGEFNTTGVNPYIALQNAQGTISVAARSLTITGFNLANMVRAANAVRTVDDIQKLIQFADQGGTTNIDVMQGNITLGGGYLRSPGIMIGTKEGNGSINGQLNLQDRDLNAAITLYLSTLTSESPPSIRLIFAGPLNKATRSLDTQSLESFIAKRAAERILEER